MGPSWGTVSRWQANITQASAGPAAPSSATSTPSWRSSARTASAMPRSSPVGLGISHRRTKRSSIRWSSLTAEGYALRRDSERIAAMSLGDALRIVFRRDHLRRTVKIALVVGTILTLINQLDILLKGQAATLTWIKVGLNYCVPFIVSNLGLLAGKRAEIERAKSS